MPIGMSNATNITIENITQVYNASSMVDVLVNVNHIIYNGVYWFVMLWILFIILFVAANKVKDQPMQNAMYSSAAISILSLVLRSIYIVKDGVVLGLLTDHQLWVFPIITMFLAAIIWATKRD